MLEVYISMGFALKKNPVLDRFWRTFLKLCEKGVCGVDCVTRKKLENWRVWAAMLRADFMICLGEPVLRAPAVHGVSSMTFDVSPLLREALFTSVRTVKTGMLVRSSVRPSVQIFSDFCEEDMRGGHMPLPLGVLNYEFEGF